MTEKRIGVSPDRVFGLQKDYSEKAHIAMNENDEQFFDAFEAFLKADYNQKNELIEKVLGEVKYKSFTVGKVFQRRKQNFVPQDYGNAFKALLWESNQNKIISIRDAGTKRLKQYSLPKNMDNEAIHNEMDSVLMEECQFWAIVYLLIIEPKLGKKILKYELQKNHAVYIFHVKLDSGMAVCVDVSWRSGLWYFEANFFISKNLWIAGRIFLFQ